MLQGIHSTMTTGNFCFSAKQILHQVAICSHGQPCACVQALGRHSDDVFYFLDLQLSGEFRKAYIVNAQQCTRYIAF